MGSNLRRLSAISRVTSSMRLSRLPYSWEIRHAFFLPAGASRHSWYASSTMARSIVRPLQYVFIPTVYLSGCRPSVRLRYQPSGRGHFRRLTRHARCRPRAEGAGRRGVMRARRMSTRLARPDVPPGVRQGVVAVDVPQARIRAVVQVAQSVEQKNIGSRRRESLGVIIPFKRGLRPLSPCGDSPP